MHFRTAGHESCVVRWAHRECSQGFSPLSFPKKSKLKISKDQKFRQAMPSMFPEGGALPFQFCPSARTDTHSLGTWSVLMGMAGTVRTFPRCATAVTFTGLSLNGAATVIANPAITNRDDIDLRDFELHLTSRLWPNFGILGDCHGVLESSFFCMLRERRRLMDFFALDSARKRRCVECVSISAAAQLPMKLGNVCVTRPEAPGFSLLCDTINLPYRTGCAGRTSGGEGEAAL
ncbi:hypothetical protein GE21DRAFT_1122697 [Neurospora crassa]|nr:hypothetical protein GE21DRAFT_1122697 [Neurospora crassa]